MSSSHPTSSNNYTDGYELMNLDVHHQSRKRQASEAASRHDDFKRSSHYDVQNMNPRRFGFEPADLHHQPLHEYYQQQRPDQGHTPPLDDHQEEKKYAELLKTPMENIAQPSSVILTPESPDEIALTAGPSIRLPVNNTIYQQLCQQYSQSDYNYQDAMAQYLPQAFNKPPAAAPVQVPKIEHQEQEEYVPRDLVFPLIPGDPGYQYRPAEDTKSSSPQPSAAAPVRVPTPPRTERQEQEEYVPRGLVFPLIPGDPGYQYRPAEDTKSSSPQAPGAAPVRVPKTEHQEQAGEYVPRDWVFPLLPGDPGYRRSRPADDTPEHKVNTVKSQLNRKSRNPDDYPTFGRIEPDGTKVVTWVDGRLPCVGVRTKCQLTANELRRRVAAPEYMNLSTVYCFLRKTKTKKSIEAMKTMLIEHNIQLSEYRQRETNRFSGFLEDDATGLAVDLRMLHRKYFDEQPVAQQMVFNLLVKGYTPVQCHAMLKKTSAVLQHIVDSLGTRQPAVANRNEVLKTNDCDLPYHIFNLYTHGFGHANSIDHYKEQLAINQKAELLASALIHNIPIPPIELWKDGEKPFTLLSDHEAQNMIAVQCFRVLKKLSKVSRTMELRRFTFTDPGQKIVSMLSTINNDLLS